MNDTCARGDDHAALSGDGWIDGRVHTLPLRVYWEDTDGGGIVYYANYLKFTERGRTDFLRCLGVNQRQILDETGIAFAVKDCRIEYLAPARLDDRLTVVTKLAKLGGATVEMDQWVRRGEVTLIESRVRLACVDRLGRPKRLPPVVKDAFRLLVGDGPE